VAPETLIFTTTASEFDGVHAGDEVLVERDHFGDAVAFISITGGSAHLTLGEAQAMRDQLESIIADAS